MSNWKGIDPVQRSTTSGDATLSPSGRLGVAAAAELRQVVRSALIGVFGPFLKKLQVALLTPGVTPSRARDRLEDADLVRAVAHNEKLWIETFLRQVDVRFIGDTATDPAQRVQILPDDTMVASAAELRAEIRYKALVAELDASLNTARGTLYVPLSSRALAPAGLFRALQETANAMGWPMTRRAALFELFEQLFIPTLDGFYRGLSATIARVQIVAPVERAAPAATPPLTAKLEAPTPPLSVPTAAPTATVKPTTRHAVPEHLDNATRSMLAEQASMVVSDEYNDGRLAAELLALAEAQRIAPSTGNGGASSAPLQRMTLAGEFLNRAVADPLVPRDLRQHHEAVRFPLVKSALADVSLFTSATHPLATLVNEAMLKAATSRVTGDVEMRLSAERLHDVVAKFDLSPEFVRQAMDSAQPIPETQVQWFFDLQQRQAELRRETVINEAKRRVIRELEQSAFGRDIPSPALQFMKSAWGLLLTKRLVENGADHAGWRAGLVMLNKFLDVLETRGGTPTSEWMQLVGVMTEELRATGVPENACALARSHLDEAWRSRAMRPFI